MTGLDLRCHIEFRRPHHFRRSAGRLAFGGPSGIVNAGMRAARHQFMIRRMEFDFVALVAPRIERAQLGRILVGDTAAGRHRGGTPVLAKL